MAFIAKELAKIKYIRTNVIIGYTNVVQTCEFWKKIQISHARDVVEVTLILHNHNCIIKINNDKFEEVKSFYLVHITDQIGSCFVATMASIRSAWRNICDLLPILTNGSIILQHRGFAYQFCIKSVQLYASETYSLNIEDTIIHLEQNHNELDMLNQTK